MHVILFVTNITIDYLHYRFLQSQNQFSPHATLLLYSLDITVRGTVLVEY